MAITQAAVTLQSSTSNSTGNTTTGTGYDKTGKYGMAVTLRITNGGTGPSAGCRAILDVSNDGTNWRTWYDGLAGTDNNGVYDFPVVIPKDIMYVRSRFTGNTGQSVTVEALAHVVTGV